MTQAKHTPGPWYVYPHGDSPGIDADNFSIVLFGESDLEDGGVRGENEAEAMANARLIAAAPDLLAALKRVLIGGNHVALLIGADHPPHTATHDEALTHYGACDAYEAWCCWKTVMEAREAIAKAEGA